VRLPKRSGFLRIRRFKSRIALTRAKRFGLDKAAQKSGVLLGTA
jgi:hypothetical protein